jgi:hypothetical protein
MYGCQWGPPVDACGAQQGPRPPTHARPLQQPRPARGRRGGMEPSAPRVRTRVRISKWVTFAASCIIQARRAPRRLSAAGRRGPDAAEACLRGRRRGRRGGRPTGRGPRQRGSRGLRGPRAAPRGRCARRCSPCPPPLLINPPPRPPPRTPPHTPGVRGPVLLVLYLRPRHQGEAGPHAGRNIHRRQRRRALGGGRVAGAGARPRQGVGGRGEAALGRGPAAAGDPGASTENQSCGGSALCACASCVRCLAVGLGSRLGPHPAQPLTPPPSLRFLPPSATVNFG